MKNLNEMQNEANLTYEETAQKVGLELEETIFSKGMGFDPHIGKGKETNIALKNVIMDFVKGINDPETKDVEALWMDIESQAQNTTVGTLYQSWTGGQMTSILGVMEDTLDANGSVADGIKAIKAKFDPKIGKVLTLNGISVHKQLSELDSFQLAFLLKWNSSIKPRMEVINLGYDSQKWGQTFLVKCKGMIRKESDKNYSKIKADNLLAEWEQRGGIGSDVAEILSQDLADFLERKNAEEGISDNTDTTTPEVWDLKSNWIPTRGDITICRPYNPQSAARAIAGEIFELVYGSKIKLTPDQVDACELLSSVTPETSLGKALAERGWQVQFRKFRYLPADQELQTLISQRGIKEYDKEDRYTGLKNLLSEVADYDEYQLKEYNVSEATAELAFEFCNRIQMLEESKWMPENTSKSSAIEGMLELGKYDFPIEGNLRELKALMKEVQHIM